jgi:hypothetical protein
VGYDLEVPTVTGLESGHFDGLIGRPGDRRCRPLELPLKVFHKGRRYGRHAGLVSLGLRLGLSLLTSRWRGLVQDTPDVIGPLGAGVGGRLGGVLLSQRG